MPPENTDGQAFLRGRKDVSNTDLNHAWALSLGGGEDRPEVKIVRENHVSVVDSPVHDRPIGCARISCLGPVHAGPSLLSQNVAPVR